MTLSEVDRESKGLGQRIARTRDTADYQVEQVIDGNTEAIVDRLSELALTRKDLAGRGPVAQGRPRRSCEGKAVSGETVRRTGTPS